MNGDQDAGFLKEQYQQDALSQEEYFDRIVYGIRKDSHFHAFMKCVYEELFDEEDESSRVSAYSNEELWEAIDLLKAECSTWEGSQVPAYLDMLRDSLGQSGYGLLVRWALSKLVGMSLADKASQLKSGERSQ